MGELSKFFDAYSFNARVKPALFLIFPVFIALLVLFEPSRTWAGGAVTFLISFGVLDFAANQMSTKGNALQDRLFREWGGAPTTIILRHSDSSLDRFTKARYMERLGVLIPNFTPVTAEFEEKYPEKADELYVSAVNYLRELTRDVKKYPLVFKENIAYGFSRNVRAFKPLGMILAASSLLVSSVVIVVEALRAGGTSIEAFLREVPFAHFGLLAIHMALILAWTFLVTDDWVKMRGFAYAKRLCSVCERPVD